MKRTFQFIPSERLFYLFVAVFFLVCSIGTGEVDPHADDTQPHVRENGRRYPAPRAEGEAVDGGRDAEIEEIRRAVDDLVRQIKELEMNQPRPVGEVQEDLENHFHNLQDQLSENVERHEALELKRETLGALEKLLEALDPKDAAFDPIREIAQAALEDLRKLPNRIDPVTSFRNVLARYLTAKLDDIRESGTRAKTKEGVDGLKTLIADELFSEARLSGDKSEKRTTDELQQLTPKQQRRSQPQQTPEQVINELDNLLSGSKVLDVVDRQNGRAPRSEERRRAQKELDENDLQQQQPPPPLSPPIRENLPLFQPEWGKPDIHERVLRPSEPTPLERKAWEQWLELNPRK